MSKSKSSSKAAKPTTADTLTKVKDAAVVKPAQNIKSKSKELAKQVATKEDKKEKKSKKKAKEPTPEPSDSEESDSSESSESEAEKKASKPAAKVKASGSKKPTPAVKPASDSESEEESDSDDSEVEAPKANGAGKKVGSAKAKVKAAESSDESDSDESMADAGTAAKGAASDEDSDDSSDESSEDEKPVTKVVNKVAETAQAVKESVKKAVVGSDSENDSDDSDSSEESDEEKEVPARSIKRKAEDAAAQTPKKTKTEAVDTSKGANLFVGNLSWNVDEAWLKEVFEEFGELAGVRIVTDRDSGRSKGFGYVEFANAEDAAKAHAAKAGTELDGRNLNVDFANARPDASQKQENRRKSYGDQVSEPSDTLFVGNLSFEVGQEAVTEAFAPHGTILGIRLPTDRDTGAPKGFGYVTFGSAEEAGAAMEAMQGAYIENRPIRLDYSSPRPQNSDSPARGRGGFGGRGGGRGAPRGGRGGRGGSFGGRGGRGGRGGSTNRGGFGDFSGRKTNFD